MKSTYYHCRDRDNKEVHHIAVYDETQPCVLCGLPVEDASMGGTAICPTCDCGRQRPGGKHLYRPGTKINVWQNMTEGFFFPTRAEADAKMYELHQQGIVGWPRIIEREQKKRSQQ